jgi:hypothetical protein
MPRDRMARVVLPPRVMPAAVRHGAYRMGLLPGENAAAFEKQHRDLMGELSPMGPLEEDTVSTMARIMWRKNHMGIVRAAQRAWDSYDRIESRQRLTWRGS